VVVTLFNELSQHYLGGIKKTTKKAHQDSRSWDWY